ncbi:TonB-dependent receptor [Proteobacteria bacterium 005FR1]|nr:TonB-dependent receptor [Proteobacteria bacterium 005FR1]
MFQKNPLASAVRSLTLASALVASGFPAIANAQDGAEIEEVVVTGSRIQREDLTAFSPIEVIGQEEIRASNTTNLEEFLRDRPQFTQAMGDNTNNGNGGAATVDLRNLGESRTLVLVNGKRFTPYDYGGAVDLGMIPTSLVKRVEIITGGASAVYGTDAIAGVVNFILVDNFEGAEFDVSTFQTTEGDAKSQDYSVTLGTNFAGGKGNVVFNAGFTDQDPLTQAERDFGSDSLDSSDLSSFGSWTTPAGTVFSSTLFNQFGADGNFVAPSEMGTFNFNPYNLFQVPQEKTTATLLGRYDFSDSLRAYGRLSYANNEIATIIAPTGTFFYPFTIDYLNNPFLGSGAVADFAAADAAETGAGANDGLVDILYGRRLPEVGTRDSVFENEALQYVLGLEGDISDSMRWEAFVQFGETEQQQNYLNDIAYDRVAESMAAVVDASGNIVCASGNPDCVPGNYFGPGNLSAEAAEYIKLNLEELRETEQLVVGASLTGDTGIMIPTADADISYALGFEFRRDEGTGRPDANYAAGNSVGFGASSPVDAETEIQEFFGEALVPVLSSVTLELGARRSEYENTASFAGQPAVSNDFSNTSYKIGADWQILEDLRARAMFQHAVRAPNLADIGIPLTPGIGDLDTDPCEGSNPVGDADLTALCVATGVPAGAIGSLTSIIAGQIGIFFGGNAELQPEEADTYTLGLVYTPSAVPGLEVALDYYDITIDEVITSLSSQEIVNSCYDSGDASNEFCQRIVRSPITGGLNAGTTVGVDVSLINSAQETTRGYDLNLNYGLELGNYGSLDLGLIATKVIEHTFQSAEGSERYDCVGLVGATCTRPDPELRFTQTTTWQMDGLRVDLIWRYIDELKQDAIELAGDAPSDWAVPVIDDYSYFNLAASYAINDNWTVRTGIDNLFDKEPPVVGNTYGSTAGNSGNTYPSTYDALGRAYFLGVNASF